MNDGQLITTPSVFGETGNFLLERELGTGGMGGVYMGRDKMLDRPVAVKVMLKELGDDAAFVEKFKREAQAAARLIHPNIAQIYSYGIADGMPYIAMELVAGGSLDQLMKNQPGKTEVPRVMKIGEQIAQALRCAADQGLVHGDVKPENILFDSNGNAKLVDFGLAAMQKDTSEIWGTPYYIAPEKVRKEVVDYRADMYSLGGTLYHALTGVPPFDGDDATAAVRKRFEGAPQRPSAIRSDLSPQIDALILKMLAMNPADRFPSFEALLEEFKKVMASGLTATSAGAAPAAAPAATAVKPTSGRKLVMKGKGSRKFKVNHTTTAGASNADAPRRSSSSDDEGDSGGVGGKVLLVIFGVIAAVGLVIGGLVWYTVADKKAREAEIQAQISAHIAEGRSSIASTREKALAFAEEFDTFAQKAVDECQKPTDDLKKAIGAQFGDAVADQIKPGPSQELLDAIASTNVVVEAETNAVGDAAAPTGTVEKVEAAAGDAAETAGAIKIPQFRPPTDDEADPMSPDHETYLKEKAEWEVKQRLEAERKAAEGQKAGAAEETAGAGDSSAVETPSASATPQNEIVASVIRDMHDLWERAYGCQAAAIRLHSKIAKLVEKIDAAVFEGETDETMQAIAAFSNEVKDEFDQIKASDEVTKVQKGIGFIKSKGGKTVKQTAERMLVAANEAARKKAAEEAAQREKERQEKIAAEKAKTIEDDNRKAKEKFEALVSAGVFSQLDWRGAIRQLEVLRDEFKYADSQILADGIILKVKMMQAVQDVILANGKGYKFAKHKLKGFTITELTEREIKFLKPDGKTEYKMSWKKFYQSCRGNLNELIIKFIEKGRNRSMIQDETGKKLVKLNLQRWAETMMGAALTMRIICSDDPAAGARSEQIAKDAVKAYPDYLKHAQEIFPDVNFDDAGDDE